MVRSELELISEIIKQERHGDALGILYAREFLRHELARGALANKILTSAWIHLSLIPHLDEVMSAAKSVVGITGRAELKDQFEGRVGIRLRSFLQVPVQGFHPPSENESHYRAVFPRIFDALKEDLRGTLVLVGAGFFGKIYCHAARESGAVAVDIGSAFDILAGKPSRCVHSRYNVDAWRWI
jgi:hypothetical protein